MISVHRQNADLFAIYVSAVDFYFHMLGFRVLVLMVYGQ